MEDKPAAPEPTTRRSKRTRAKVRPVDFTPSDKIGDDLEEEREESSDEFREPRRKAKRNKTTEGASTSAAAGRKSDLSLIGIVKELLKKWRKLHIDGWRTNRIGDERLIVVPNNSVNLNSFNQLLPISILELTILWHQQNTQSSLLI